MDDVRAVMDAVGSERAALFGISEGGPMCVLFAATYPERTRGAGPLGAYARRTLGARLPVGADPEEREAFFASVERDWGGPVGLAGRAPSRPTTSASPLVGDLPAPRAPAPAPRSR